MINIAQTLISTKPQKQFSIVLHKAIYGIGPSMAKDLIVELSGRLDTQVRFLKNLHFRWFTYQCVKNSFLLKENLRNIARNNIKHLKSINCYKGYRHLHYLPARGQRTKSNAMTARYLGSGSFDYIPTKPNDLVKKISSYVRRDTILKQNSEINYKKLLSRNFFLFQKSNNRLTSFLNKKGKLGVFSKFMKIKKKNKQKNG